MVRLLLAFACSGPPPEADAPDPGTVDSATEPTTEPRPVASVSLGQPVGVRDLVAVAEASDPLEPVSLQWSWTVDGVETAHDGDRIPASEVWPGQMWTVTVTPQAGDRVGEPATASVSIPDPVGGNVLVVVLDDWGIDKSNPHGIAPQVQRTPNLDALAAQGVLFRNAYVSPECSPTRAQLLTGRHARRTGIGGLVGGDTRLELPLDAITLPEALEGARGGTWESSAVGKWHLAAPESSSGYDSPNLQGFPWYSGSNDNLPETETGYFWWPKVTNGQVARTDVYATTDTIDDAVVQVQALPEPWLLWVAFNAPHTPYHVPPAELTTVDPPAGSPGAELYAAMLEALDTELGRLLGHVDLAETTVIVIGDNGTGRIAVQAPFRRERAKHSVYEGGVHVPLVVAGRAVPAPGETEALVHAVDVFTTVADLAGVPLTGTEDALALDLGGGEQRQLDGISLLPWLADPDLPSARDLLYVELFDPSGPGPYTEDLRTIRDARYKLMRTDFDGVVTEMLFDLESSGFDEGEDLLAAGKLTTDQQQAYDRLSTAMADQLAAMPYEGF